MTMQELSHRLHYLMQLTTMVLTPLWSMPCASSGSVYAHPTPSRQKTSFALLPMSVQQWPVVPAPGGPTLSQTPPTPPLP